MFLRSTKRKKDGKQHRYFSVVENVRAPGRRTPFQKTLLYLGEINDAQQSAWVKVMQVFDEASCQSRNLTLIPDDRCVPSTLASSSLSVSLADYQLKRPRQYGACWPEYKCWMWNCRPPTGAS